MFKCLDCGKKFEDYKILNDYKNNEDIYVCPFCRSEDFKVADPDEPETPKCKTEINPNTCQYCWHRSVMGSEKCLCHSIPVNGNHPACADFDFNEKDYLIDKEFFG